MTSMVETSYVSDTGLSFQLDFRIGSWRGRLAIGGRRLVVGTSSICPIHHLIQVGTVRNDSLNVLSAEPLSSTAPQLSEDARFIRVIQKRAGRTLALTCPGQGHPPPTKRSVGEHSQWSSIGRMALFL